MVKSRCIDQNKGMARALGVSENEVSNLQVCGGLCIMDWCNTFVCSDIDELIAKLKLSSADRENERGIHDSFPPQSGPVTLRQESLYVYGRNSLTYRIRGPAALVMHGDCGRDDIVS
jgi:hypothetical protein